MNQRIYPCIWCNNNAKELADYYSATFPNTSIMQANPVVVMVNLDGQPLMLLNGGDTFKPNPSISLMGLFSNPEAVKTLWAKVIGEGSSLMPLGAYPFSPQYGWLADKYGVSWQLYTGETGGAKENYVPTLLFTGANNGRAREAITFYTGLFPDSKLQGIMEYAESSGDTPGNVQHAQFDVLGFTMMCMDSSLPHPFNFNEGVSIVVNCHNQDEIDRYWNALTANGGQENRCGWLKDKFGVSWQIVPENMGQLMSQSSNVMNALMKMKKLDISILEAAANGPLSGPSGQTGLS
jgi:predicted 3-demethylubiquinone-9 3-methyltransferase (glyoxalase superfamily)